MPRTPAIEPRLTIKNGREQWYVTMPKELCQNGQPRRRFFHDHTAAEQYADELMEGRGSIASQFHKLDAQGQAIVAGLIQRVGFDAKKLERLVLIGEKHSVGEPVTVADAVAEFIKAKTRDGVGAHIRNYNATLTQQFVPKFQCMVGELKAPAIDDWLRNEFLNPKTRNQKRGQVLAFLHWLTRRDYVTADRRWDLTRAIEPAKDIEIFTPEQVIEALKLAGKEREKWKESRECLVPLIAIGAFAGLRNCEICRLHWEDVQLDRDLIHVRASRTKRVKNTKARVVPILPNLKEWLQPYAKESGPVVTHKRPSEALTRITQQGGFAWKKNALRHSFASYRVAVTQNEAQVATEIGDLVSTMKRHYKAAVDPKVGEQWFSILPEKS